MASGSIRAPKVGIEKMRKGDESVRSLHAPEQYTGRKVDAVIAAEVVGSNGIALRLRRPGWGCRRSIPLAWALLSPRCK